MTLNPEDKGNLNVLAFQGHRKSNNVMEVLEFL
jgi:hypothetical protein